MKNKNYISKEMFYKMSQVFFEEGLLNEIYSSDKICICNAANAGYIVFNYTISKLGPIGVVVETKYIEALIENDNLFNELCNLYSRKEFEKKCKILETKFYNSLKQIKHQTDILGPYVDLEYEKSITGNSKSR